VNGWINSCSHVGSWSLRVDVGSVDRVDVGWSWLDRWLECEE